MNAESIFFELEISYYNPNRPDTNIVKVYFFIGKPVFNGCLMFKKINGAQNQLHTTFCSDLMCNKTLKARNFKLDPHAHEF